ncbi:MAG: hypothetical protein QOJ53_1916 [Sphingomonadales bacterium]|jgi:hypothetical protein|nr:hypothetical protein [Sphingomonadales bacterium]MEA3047584.1 hypothetical protein [Sphingomonadales bacterium]
MKKPIITALVAGQLLGFAPPATAADLAGLQEQRAGAFGGFRLRIPLGGNPRAQRLRAGLTIAPTLRSRAGDGETSMRIGEGLEFGYRANRPLSFSLAGRDLDGRRFGAAEGGRSDAVPRTALAVAGVALTLGLLYWGVSEAIDCDAEEECS